MSETTVYPEFNPDHKYNRNGESADHMYTNDDTSVDHRYNSEDKISSYTTTVKYNIYSHPVYTVLPVLYNMSVRNVLNEAQLETIVFPSSDVAEAVASSCVLSNGYNPDNHGEYVSSAEYCHRAHTKTKCKHN